MGRILSGTVSQLGLAGQTLWVTAEGRSFQALATTNISSRNVSVLIDDNGRATVSDANAGRPILTETRRFHQGKGKKKEEEKTLDFVAALVRYVPSIRRDEMVTPTFDPYYEQNPELLNDIEVYLLIDGRYTLAASIPLEWRDLGTLEFIGGVNIQTPTVGPPPTGSATFNQTGNSISISTSASMNTGTASVVEALYSATFSGLALKGSVSASRSFAVSSETNGGSIIELIPFESQASTSDFFDGVNTIGGSSFAFAFTGQSSETAPYAGEFKIRASSQLDIAAASIIDASANADISLPDVEILCDRQWGRSWSYIDSQGWVVWVIAYETPLGTGYPSEGVRTDGPSYLEERIYGFSGTGKKIAKRKVYARRYHDDSTSQYAEGETIDALSFSATPIELKDFWENPKSPNLAWGQTVTPDSTDDCANEYQDRSFVSYLPKKKKVFTMQELSINAAIEDGGSIILAEQRVSATSPTCTVGPSKNLNKRIKKWTGDGDPPEAVSAAYYPT